MSYERLTLAESLEADAQQMRKWAKRRRDDADDRSAEASKLRREADQLELDAIERVTAANLLREAGLRVSFRDGLPYVSIERLLAPASEPVP